MDFRSLFKDFIRAENVDGSNKASSYIRALDLLDRILGDAAEFKVDEFWSIASVNDIEYLYEYALSFQKQEGSLFLQDGFPPSYGRNGWYSAALKSYQKFLVVNRYENQLWDIYQNPKVASEELAKRLADQDVESAELLLDGREGKDAMREVKTRIGQGFFRKMILKQYNTQCCITGLNVPEVLRASHIISWADDSQNRMNPCNGLCLSATYDAAFDKHLISFDEDYRMILSPVLKEYYTNAAFNDYFLSREGSVIETPANHLPDEGLLELHRNKLAV